MEHPKHIGDRTTLAVMLALVDAGITVAVPFGDNARYDLAAEIDGVLVRLQCKTGRLRGGAVVFATSSSYAHHPNPRTRKRDYRGEIDLFAVHCRETGVVYLVPIDGLGGRSAQLRVDPPRNAQLRRIRLAADFALSRVSVERLGARDANQPRRSQRTRRAPTQFRA